MKIYSTKREVLFSARVFAFAAIALLGQWTGLAFAGDACQMQIPRSLANAITKKFPAYRLPLETDNLAEDVAYDRKQGGTGCLGIATADFDGNRTKDYLLGLTSRIGPSGLAVIALSTKSGWRFHAIASETEGDRSRQYVVATKPGKYTWSEALEWTGGDVRPRPMKCPHWGAMVGATESTGFVYCYTKGKWSFVQTSD